MGRKSSKSSCGGHLVSPVSSSDLIQENGSWVSRSLLNPLFPDGDFEKALK